MQTFRGREINYVVVVRLSIWQLTWKRKLSSLARVCVQWFYSTGKFYSSMLDCLLLVDQVEINRKYQMTWTHVVIHWSSFSPWTNCSLDFRKEFTFIPHEILISNAELLIVMNSISFVVLSLINSMNVLIASICLYQTCDTFECIDY